MAITPSYVQVAPDSDGKLIDNVEVDTGQGDVVQRQVTVTGDPEDPDGRGRVLAALPAADAYGAVVRQAAPGFDSACVTLPNALTALTTDTIKAKGVLLCNLTSSQKLVTITDTAGAQRLKEFPLQGRMTVYVPLGDVTMVGVKWNADQAASVNAQLVGDK